MALVVLTLSVASLAGRCSPEPTELAALAGTDGGGPCVKSEAPGLACGARAEAPSAAGTTAAPGIRR
ncbi:MAG TPA: hypothetical protein VEA81_14215 [Burkholderiaceae bacterium]|nr:hypothetical protein [Burkholderiaceae bacterium]